MGLKYVSSDIAHFEIQLGFEVYAFGEADHVVEVEGHVILVVILIQVVVLYVLHLVESGLLLLDLFVVVDLVVFGIVLSAVHLGVVNHLVLESVLVQKLLDPCLLWVMLRPLDLVLMREVIGQMVLFPHFIEVLLPVELKSPGELHDFGLQFFFLGLSKFVVLALFVVVNHFDWVEQIQLPTLLEQVLLRLIASLRTHLEEIVLEHFFVLWLHLLLVLALDEVTEQVLNLPPVVTNFLTDPFYFVGLLLRLYLSVDVGNQVFGIPQVVSSSALLYQPVTLGKQLLEERRRAERLSDL